MSQQAIENALVERLRRKLENPQMPAEALRDYSQAETLIRAGLQGNEIVVTALIRDGLFYCAVDESADKRSA